MPLNNSLLACKRINNNPNNNNNNNPNNNNPNNNKKRLRPGRREKETPR
jgi:hypothetical protein